MLSSPEAHVVNLAEADRLFKYHLSNHGLSFVKQLEKIALEDPETAQDESVKLCLITLTDAIGSKLAPELQELSFLELGLSQHAKDCFGRFLVHLDNVSRRDGARGKPKLSALPSVEDMAYESYDDDFEDLSSPDKSEGMVYSELDSASPMMSKPPAAATSATVRRRSSSPSRARDREWIAKGNWRIGEKIGSGSFGEVFKGLKNDGKIVAVKRMRITAERSEELLNLANEIDLMRNMSHPNIVSYIGTKVDLENEVVYIFQEWVSGGSVHSMLSNFGPFQLDVIRTYTTQILLGLQYLHENGIVHRDIKGGNILVENSGGVKLADFGASAKVAMGDTQESKAIRGTPYFSPPENLYEVKYGRKGDIWAVGCTVVEMLTGKPPWQSDTVTTVVQLYMHIVATNGPPPIARELPDDAEDFLKVIFKMDPKERPAAKELQSHQFLSPDNYEDSMENSSYGGSSVGSNIYGSSSIDLLRLREVEVKRTANKNVSDSTHHYTSGKSAAQVSVTAVTNYRQKAGQRGLRAETGMFASDDSPVAGSHEVGSRVEARFAGLAKWLPGNVRKCHADDEGGFDIVYDNGKIEHRVQGSLIRRLNGGVDGKGGCTDLSPSNPFARQNSPGAQSFQRETVSPLPTVISPVKESAAQSAVVLTNWDAIYKAESGSELPSPFKGAAQKELASPILSGKSRAARTAPGVSRDPDNIDTFPEGVMAKKESRRDVRTAGNAADTTKVKRSTDGIERRKGSRRAAGRVARAVSETTLAPEPSRSRINNRIGPAQILRDARKSSLNAREGGSSSAKGGDHSMSSLTLPDEDGSLPTIFTVNLLVSETSKGNGKKL